MSETQPQPSPKQKSSSTQLKHNGNIAVTIELLLARVHSRKAKLQTYNSPIMQDMVKNSQYLQFEYTRVSAALEEDEDILLLLQKLPSEPKPIILQAPEKKKKTKAPKKDEQA